MVALCLGGCGDDGGAPVGDGDADLDGDGDADGDVGGDGDADGDGDGDGDADVPPPELCTSITRDSVMVTFADERPCGQYANGDWWIVGPVTITEKTPSDIDGIEPHLHGCMINPTNPPGLTMRELSTTGGSHGFDSRLDSSNELATVGIHAHYESALNVCETMPFTVEAAQTLAIAASGPECPGGAHSSFCLDDVVVLTIVSEPPAPGSFRPPWSGSDKVAHAEWNASAIRYEVLQNFPAVPDLPTLEEATERLRRPWMYWTGDVFFMRQVWARLASPYGAPYGREADMAIDAAMALLHTDYSDAEKQALAIAIVQKGIDVYGQVMSGMRWHGSGGFGWGEKTLLVVGASLIGDAQMMATASPDVSPNVFSFDGKYKYLTQSDVDTPRACVGNEDRCVPYTEVQIGMPEACSGNWNLYPAQCPNHVRSLYRWQHNKRFVQAIAIRLMSLEDEWGNDAFFDYFLDSTRLGATGEPETQWGTYSPECEGSPGTNDIPRYACGFYEYRDAAPIDGSI